MLLLKKSNYLLKSSEIINSIIGYESQIHSGSKIKNCIIGHMVNVNLIDPL